MKTKSENTIEYKTFENLEVYIIARDSGKRCML
jgi:hypothetical protein